MVSLYFLHNKTSNILIHAYHNIFGASNSHAKIMSMFGLDVFICIVRINYYELVILEVAL